MIAGKYLSILILSLFTSTYSFSQVKLEDVVKVGSKLMYRLDNKGRSYDCVVTIRQLKPVVYEYKVIDSANAEATITHTTQALKNGYKLFVQFDGNNKQLDNETTGLWLSNNSYRQFSRHKRRPIDMKINDHETYKMGAVKGPVDFNVKLNGEMKTVKEEVVKSKIKFSRRFVETGDEFIGFYRSERLPIITRLKTDFYLELLTIVP